MELKNKFDICDVVSNIVFISDLHFDYTDGKYLLEQAERKEDEFKERFDAITDDTAIYPLIPKYDEKHELFIITSSNEVDSNWLRERLDMQHMKSYKTGKISKSNVIDIKDVRHALQNSNTKS